MKRKLLALIPISMSLSILFGACSNTATVSTEVESSNEITTTLDETETQTSTSTTTSSTTTTEEPTTTEPTTTVPPTTTEPATTTKKDPIIEPVTTHNSTTATTMAPVRFNGPVEANRFIDHGKVLNVYGDLDPNDSRVLELQSILKGYKKKISLVVWRKDGSKAVSFNTQATHFSACTIKAGFMLNVCKLIDKGVADENTMMAYEEKYYHRGSGRIRKNPYGSKYSLKTLVNLSLSISDNVAYKMLNAYFGRDEYNAYMKQLGCNSLVTSGMWASKANVRDYIIVWNEIYDYVLSDAKMAETLKTACTNTDFNYGTETLPDGIDYSHKSGDNFGASAAYNDAGIVWHDNAYIYAIFTNSEGTSYDIKTVNSIMEIIYDIMTE